MNLREEVAARAYLAGWALVRFLPARVATGLFNWGADLASQNGRGMDQLRRNLSRVVGPENVTRALVRDSLRSYLRYWQEAFRLPTIHADASLRAQLTRAVEGIEHLDASIARGQGVILALTHAGNWDMAGVFLVHYFGRFTTVAERLKPEKLFAAFVDFRSNLGFEVIALTGDQEPPLARLAQVLEAGGIVCLLAERDLRRTGVTVDFFGEEANMAAGPAVLAAQTGAALHVAASWFVDDGWGFSVSPPLEVTDVQATTQRMADLFAANIAAHPADWHMLQPLWNADIERHRAQRASSSREQRATNHRAQRSRTDDGDPCASA